jgi:hypothetical protein
MEQIDLSTLTTLRVIAVDPGETTGYAHGYITGGEMLIATGQAAWTHRQLHEHLGWYQPHIIVCETFDFRRSPRAQRDRVNLYAKEMIGIIELYVEETSWPVQLHYQTPSQVMQRVAYFNPKRLKEENIHKPGKKHADEAARHLLYWFTFGKGFKYNEKGYTHERDGNNTTVR